jgi:putative ABC transport system substrate-binding protein
VAGINNRHADVVAKQIETLKRILPKLNEFGLFGLEGDPHSELVYQRYEKLQQTAGIKTHRVMFRNVEDARAAFASRAKGVKVGAEVSMFPQIMTGKEFASLAAANGIVTVSSEGAEDGVFMSLDTDYAAARFRLAEMLVKVLHGTPLSEIPFEQPTKYYLAFNMKTAKALGITIPPEVLLRADRLHE